MGNERKLRLIQVAKEFKVGLNTVTDFLQKKGIKSDGSPNTLVDAETYAVLEKEFGANRSAASARDSIRERISLKQTTVTLEEARKQEREEEKEVVIKSNVISVKDEIQQPKFLGKIDLSPKPKPKAAPAPQPKPAPEAEAVKPAPQPAAPAAKAEEAPKAPEAVKPAPAPAPAPQPKPAETPKPAAAATPAPAKAAAPVQEAPKRETPAPASQPKAAETPAPKPAPAPQAAPAAQAAPAPAPAAEPKPEAPKDNIFRPETVTLTGPQVLGTMDVSGFVAGGKHKRKRLQKEKVDVSKAPKGNAQGGGNRQGQGGQNNNGNRSGGQGQNRGGGQNQPRPGEGRRNKGKNAPKPIVRPEVSDEEVSKQVKDTLARLTAKGSKSKSSKYRKDKREAVAERMNEEFEREEMERSTLKVTEFVTVSELATMMNVAPTEVIMACMNLGLMVSINQRLDAEALVVVAEEFGYKTEFVSVEIQEAIADDSEDREEDLVPRPPIVTVMGHVDHGKTSLLDNIRKTNVIEGEAGGITQHIGAYSVVLNGQKITFLDTPGHEAFTTMRARGAMVTDIAILVVAADDGIMPQTIESINHAKAAGTPIVVAINKMDLPGANPDRIKQDLTKYDLVPEEWGGDTIVCPISAKTGAGVKELLENLVLQAEIMELKANPNRPARGTVVEARLDKGRGPIMTVLVQNGTLHTGDIIIAGTAVGRVRVMTNDRGERITDAGPSVPVEIAGMSEVPSAGDVFNAVADERMARALAEERLAAQRSAAAAGAGKKVSLEDLFARIQEGDLKDFNIIVKADVQGSAEAVKTSLEKLSNEEVRVRVIHSGVGAINESDVMLASTSNAVIVGFNVRPDNAARDSAERSKVELRMYRVIYDCINDVEAAMKGMLAPKFHEVIIGHAEVRQTFRVSKVGTVCGCYVQDGKIQRNCSVRVNRDNIVIFEGELASLRRFKDDVKEVSAGYECGMQVEKFNDIKEGDVIECFVNEQL